MNEKRFQELVKSMTEEEMKEHVRKSEDYADPGRTNDVLANFKEGAIEIDTTPIKYLLTHMNKHIRALYRYTKHGKTASEDINGRIKDARNYLALLRALLIDEQNETLSTSLPPGPTTISGPSPTTPRCEHCNNPMHITENATLVLCRNCGRAYNITYNDLGAPILNKSKGEDK